MQQKMVKLFKASEILNGCAHMGIFPVSLLLVNAISNLFNWNLASWVFLVVMVLMSLELVGARMIIFAAMDMTTDVNCDEVAKGCRRMAIVLFAVSWLPMIVSFSMRSKLAMVWFALSWIIFGLAYVAELYLAGVMLSVAARESKIQNSEIQDSEVQDSE